MQRTIREQRAREQERERAPAPVDGGSGPPPPPPPARLTGSPDELVVTGQRPRGSVIADVPPERTFNTLDINAYGASNVGELINALGPQVTNGGGDGGGRPVTLLNGRRVSSFTEIADIPTEAIERMEVFPPELALRYGYRPDQKVVNIVTFERFRSDLVQVGGSLATDGGYASGIARGNHFAIRGNTRFDLTADYARSAAVLESDRDLAQPAGAGGAMAGQFRTLLPATERFALNGLVSGTVADDVSGTLNARYEENGYDRLLGPGPAGPLTQRTESQAAHVGTTLHGRWDRWMWTATGNYDRLQTETVTDTADQTRGRDRARSVSVTARADLLLTGSLLRLPAGPVSASLRGSVELRDFEGVARRGGVEQGTDLSRNSGAFLVNLDAPIARRRAGERSWLGALAVNGVLGAATLPGFGTLRTYGYGLRWSPVERIDITASVTQDQTAPTMEQVAAPLLVTPNVRTFDLARREVVDITQLFGGNPGLLADDRRAVRIGLNARPLAGTDLTVSVDYRATRIDDPIASFPIVTPAVEAAFPDRFTRDPSGRLRSIDARPLNFARSRQEQLRWGVNFTRPLGTVEPWMRNASIRTFSSEADARAAVSPNASVTIAQPNSAMARRFENLASRFNISLYHTWHWRDEILPRPGAPVLDLLDGSAVDLNGGQRRHEVELQAGLYRRGLGGRVSLDWQSGTTLRGAGGAGAAGDLSFSDLLKVDLNLFLNLDRFGSAVPAWLHRARATLSVTNLLNARPQVRDADGLVPLSYQPAYLDPLGRVVTLGIRMTF